VEAIRGAHGGESRRLGKHATVLDASREPRTYEICGGMHGTIAMDVTKEIGGGWQLGEGTMIWYTDG